MQTGTMINHCCLCILLSICAIVSADDCKLGQDCGTVACKTDQDCGPSECCLTRGFWPYYSSVCSKYLLEDEACMTGPEFINRNRGKYMNQCPCGEGLSCLPNYTVDKPIFGRFRYQYRCTHGV